MSRSRHPPLFVLAVLAGLGLLAVAAYWLRGTSHRAPVGPTGAAAPAVPVTFNPPRVEASTHVEAATPPFEGIEMTGIVSELVVGVLAGARVGADCGRVGGEQATYSARADEGGRYRLVVPRRTCWLTASAAGYAIERRSVDPTSAPRQDFRLSPGAQVSGLVVWRDSTVPVEAAVVEVAVAVPPGVGAPSAPVVSGPDGSFVFPGLQPGTYDVTARLGAAVSGTQRLSVSAADLVQGLTLALAPGLEVHGRIVDGSGEAVPEAQVAVAGGGAFVSDATGVFVLRGLAPGAIEVLVAASGYVTRAVELGTLTETERGVRIQLERAPEIRGVVLSPDGRPASGVQVTVRSSDGPRLMVGAAISGPDGTFSLAVNALGAVWLLADDERWGSTRAAFTLHQDQPITLRLEDWASVAGRVVGSEVTARAGVEVRASTLGPGPTARTLSRTTDIQGQFTFSKLPVGPVLIELAGVPSAARVLDLNSGQREVGVVLIEPAADRTLAGVVLDGAGMPVDAALVDAFASGQGRAAARTLTGPDGRFVLAGLQPVSHTLRVHHAYVGIVRKELVHPGPRDVIVRVGDRERESAAVFAGED